MEGGKLHEISDCRKAQRCPEPCGGAGSKGTWAGIFTGKRLHCELVHTLFAYAPELRPYVAESFGEGWKKVRRMLDDTEKTDMLLSAMAEKLQSMSPSDRGYEACTKAYDRLSAYKDGTFSLLHTPAAAPEKTVKPKIDHREQPQDAAKSALQRLKKQAGKPEKGMEQLSFDFSGDTFQTMPEPAKEPASLTPKQLYEAALPELTALIQLLNFSISHVNAAACWRINGGKNIQKRCFSRARGTHDTKKFSLHHIKGNMIQPWLGLGLIDFGYVFYL